jgi:hypothetical protein
MSAAAFAAESGAPASGVVLKEVQVSSGDHPVHLSLATFSDRDFRIRVIDNARADGTPKFTALPEAMASNGCFAGCNGGFFNRQPFDPVGGMTSDSRQVSPVDRSNWMKGLLVVRASIPALVSIDAFQDSANVTDLLQSGTWLVREGRSEIENSEGRTARRTFVCHNGKGTWGLGAADPCSLHELAALLRSSEVTALLDIQFALNLDGGPSTGLWVKGFPTDFYLRERWSVRNYVGIIRRGNP